MGQDFPGFIPDWGSAAVIVSSENFRRDKRLFIVKVNVIMKSLSQIFNLNPSSNIGITLFERFVNVRPRRVLEV